MLISSIWKKQERRLQISRECINELRYAKRLSAHFYQMMTAQRLLWLIKTCHVVKKSPRVSPLSRLQQHLLEKLMKPSALNILFCWWSWPAHIQRQPFIWSLSKGLLCRIFKPKINLGEITHMKLFFRPITRLKQVQTLNAIRKYLCLAFNSDIIQSAD